MKVDYNVETITVKQTVVKNVIRLSANDISNIVKDYIRSQGYDSIKVDFAIGNRYVADERNMCWLTSYFLDGATVEVDSVSTQRE